MVVTTLAQRLPVGAIPEQDGISAVRNDVIDHSSRRQFADFSAFCAQRILFEELRPGRAPFSVITAISGIASYAIIAEFCMLFAVDTAVA